MSRPGSVIGAAKLIALATLLSRITGLARDALLAQTFGLTRVLDAFNFGFQIPNLFRRLLGEGAMASVFVPTFTQALERDGREAAWQLLARALALLSVALFAIVTIIELFLLVLWLLRPDLTLVISLTALMLPFMLTICVVALLAAVLNCLGSFAPAALAPILLNVSMIAALLWLAPALYPAAPERQVYVVGASVVVAGVLQILVLIPVLRRRGVRLGWRWAPRDPQVQKMLRLLGPVMLGQGVLALGVYIDAQLAWLLHRGPQAPPTFAVFGLTLAYPLQEGALSAITIAQRLYQFPLGVLVISLATAAMPTFSRYAARGDWAQWQGEVRQTLRLALFEGILTGAMMFVLAPPIIRLLFQYERFDATDTARAAHVLRFYGLAMWAFCAQHIVTRAFYSIGDVKTPLRIVGAMLPLNIALTLALVWAPAVREAAFAISAATSSALAVVVGLVLLQRRRAAHILGRELLWPVGKMLLAGIVSAGAVAWLHAAAADWLERIPLVLLRRSVETFGLLGCGAALFLGLAALLKLPEPALLIRKLERKH